MSVSIACVAVDNAKVFVAHRQAGGDMGGRWEFPGGKLELGESFKDAIIREMKEEFGVEVKVGSFITQGDFEHKGKACTVHAFEIKFPYNGIETPFNLTEHTEYKWVELDDIPNLSFVDSDLSLYPEIKKYIKNKMESK